MRQGTGQHYRRGSLHSCECWLLFVVVVVVDVLRKRQTNKY